MALIKTIQFKSLSIDKIVSFNSRISIVLSDNMIEEIYLSQIDNIMQGSLKKLLESAEFRNLANAESLFIPFPIGLQSSGLQLIKVKANANTQECRLVGGLIASEQQKKSILLITGAKIKTLEILHGFFLKAYKFDYYKSKFEVSTEQFTLMSTNYDTIQDEFQFTRALLEGIYFTRDLVNEPANILNTIEFAKRLKLLTKYGLEVEVLEESSLKKLGMRALLAVGQGSQCPSKVVTIKWKGVEPRDKPLVLVGKGVVFDSGGISLKPAGGMEDMVMDMGGAGVVAGTMKALALRQSKANVIGLIGLVENMPDGNAQRPGDVVKTMKGDTVEVVNTDAEGRLVLCDLLWYAQKFFEPKAIIDLATLTGAVIVALGNDNAGVFSNCDTLCKHLLEATEVEGEGAWRLPLNESYEKLLKSRVADIANVGGRAAGAVTAAKFLENFIIKDLPWVHIDIAGVSFSKSSSKLSAQGATGWGVSSINRLIYNHYENKK